MMRVVFLTLMVASLAQANLKPVQFDHSKMARGVSDVSDSRLMELLQEQINVELTASYMYQAYAALYGRADVALPGFRKYFSAFSKEERGHAETFIEYVNKRGGDIDFPKVAFDKNCDAIVDEARKIFGLEDLYDNTGCICYMVAKVERPNDETVRNHRESCEAKRQTWKHGLYGMTDALAIERVVYDKLYTLHKQAGRDPVLIHILEHGYLTEQVEDIKELSDHVTRLQRFARTNEYSVGEYLVDRDLS